MKFFGSFPDKGKRMDGGRNKPEICIYNMDKSKND